jgi:hypothetical protein
MLAAANYISSTPLRLHRCVAGLLYLYVSCCLWYFFISVGLLGRALLRNSA